MFKNFNSKNMISILLIVLSVSILLYAFPTGITGVTQKSSTPGCTCHTQNPAANVSVTINGPDQLEPGEIGQYSVEISGGPLAAAGTNIAASTGILNIAGSNLQKIGSELTHTSPKSPSNNMVTFEFEYTAPSEPGDITLYANGNSVNLNGNNTGDQWNFAPNKVVTVEMSTDVNDDNFVVDEYKLAQNYPNPFNPSTQINFNIPESGDVRLIIYNSLGDEVAILINEFKAKGNYTSTFNAEKLASGVYYYKLTSRNFVETKKMLLLK